MAHRKTRSNLITKKLPRTTKSRLTALVVAGAAVGLTGSIFILATQAAGYVVSVEAESGTKAGTASVVSDANASGGSAVKFGGSGTITCDQAGIQKLVDSVSAQKIEANLRALVQDDSKPTPNELISRHVSSPGNQIKVDWAKQQYASYGLQIIEQPFTSNGYDLENVVGRLAGSEANTLYATGGHIDATNSNDADNGLQPAPGAEDDGSGVVVAMEAGRVMKAWQPCMKASIDFIGFNDEEEDFGGNSKYIDELSGKTFKGLLNMDMVGWAGEGECMYNFLHTSSRDKPLTDKITSVNTKYGISLMLKNGTYSADDIDAAPFWDANLPAAHNVDCGTQDDDYPGYHMTTDKTNYINFPMLAKLAKIIVASLAELSSQ